MKTDNKTDTAPLAGSSSSTKPYNQQTKEYLARNPINVLVVDDDVVCLSLVSNLLKKWNYRVTIAKDAFDALRTLRSKEGVEFDLVITDVHMPEMDGFALHDQIRTEFGDLPVLFMSVDRDDEIVAKGLMTGGLAYLQKPLNDYDLRDLWQYVLTTKNNSIKLKSGGHIIVPDITNNTEKRTIISKNIITIERIESALKNIKHSNDHVNNDLSNNDSNRSSTDGEIKIKQNKMIWTTHLHNRFEEALRALGEKAVPRYILEFMNIPGLTREQVASHLQKYRLHLKRPVENKKNVKKQLSLLSKSHNSLKFDDAIQRQMSSSSLYESGSSSTVARSSSELANLSSLNHQAPTDLRNSVIAGVNSLLTMCEQQQGAPTPFLNEGTSNTSTSNWRNCKSTTSLLDLIFSRKPGDPSDLSSLIWHGSNRHWTVDHQQQNKQVDSNLSRTSTGLSHAGDLIPINGQYHPTDKQQILVGTDPPNLGESSSGTGCGGHAHQDLIRNIENLLMTDEPHQPDNMTLDIDETLIANNSYSPVGHSIRGGVHSQWEIGESSRHGNSNPSACYPFSGSMFEDDNLLASLFATEENLPSESCNKEIE